MIPQKNATVTAVTRGGVSEDYDAPSGAGASILLSGSFDAYVSSRHATMQEAATLDRTTISYGIVPGDTGIDWQTGDVLTVALNRNGGVIERTVREVRDRQIDNLPPQPIRLDFEEA